METKKGQVTNLTKIASIQTVTKKEIIFTSKYIYTLWTTPPGRLLMINFINAITTGVIDSVVFATMVYLLQMFRYRQRLKNKFDKKTFLSFYKEVPGDSVQTITLTVKHNLILFKGTRTRDGDPFEGELIMNPINLKIGEGFPLISRK